MTGAMGDFDRAPPGAPHTAAADRLKPRARDLYYRMESAQHVQPVLVSNYLVKGWFDRGALSTLYGPSNVGKSFLALDLAHHVQEGRPWFGRRVAQGSVLYVAAETGGTFDNRVAALGDASFWLLKGDFSFRDAEPLAEAMRELCRSVDRRFDLIIFDTRSRIMQGADENAGPDVARLVAEMDALRRMTGAHVLLVDHTGKDRSRGIRMHSSWDAALDTAVLCEAEDMGGFNLVTAKATKQRDLAVPPPLQYSLRTVELGLDQDGDPVTSCVVEPNMEGRHG